MTQFLIVYDQLAGKVLDLREFDDADRNLALTERFRLERDHVSEEHVEIMVLGASTRKDLERTHARYFKTVSELAEDH